MLRKNVIIVSFGVLLYMAVMTITAFWIIPTLESLFHLSAIWIVVLSMGAAVTYIVVIMRLMLYLESKREIFTKLESRKGDVR